MKTVLLLQLAAAIHWAPVFGATTPAPPTTNLPPAVMAAQSGGENHVTLYNSCPDIGQSDTSDSHYSVFRSNNITCHPTLPKYQSPPQSGEYDTPHPGQLDPEFIQAQMAGITTIFFGQVYGGTQFLGQLWRSSGILLPYFMERDEQYGLTKNFLAISPMFLALGFMNDYLATNNATESRVFISNFIGFNLALLWKNKIFRSSHRYLAKADYYTKHHPSRALVFISNSPATHRRNTMFVFRFIW